MRSAKHGQEHARQPHPSPPSPTSTARPHPTQLLYVRTPRSTRRMTLAVLWCEIAALLWSQPTTAPDGVCNVPSVRRLPPGPPYDPSVKLCDRERGEGCRALPVCHKEELQSHIPPSSGSLPPTPPTLTPLFLYRHVSCTHPFSFFLPLLPSFSSSSSYHHTHHRSRGPVLPADPTSPPRPYPPTAPYPTGIAIPQHTNPSIPPPQWASTTSCRCA